MSVCVCERETVHHMLATVSRHAMPDSGATHRDEAVKRAVVDVCRGGVLL